MSQIGINNLTFYYDGSFEAVFEDLSLTLDTDWRLGLVGRNGKGKTTLLRLLMGEYEYRGSISAQTRFAYFPYDVPDPTKTVWEICDEIFPDTEWWRLEKEFALLKLDEGTLYRQFDTLSNGERTKVLIGMLFLNEKHFLLIDEPTNHLDMEGREIIGEYLRRKKGFILVSHDRALLDCVCDHILALERTKTEILQGNFSTWMENKARRDQFEQAESEKLKKEVSRLADAARKSSDWSNKAEKGKINGPDTEIRVDRGFVGHKAAKMMKRSKGIEARREKALEEKSELLRNTESTEKLKISPLKHHKSTIVSAQDLSLAYGEKEVFSNLTFTLKQGECLAIHGKNGSGKSSLVSIVRGVLEPTGGSIGTASGLVISYVPQDTSGLSGELSDFIEEHKLNEPLFKAILRKLDFPRSQFEKRLEHYSAGQRKKVAIAKSLCEEAHLYIWDEPMNYIDVFSRMQLEELIAEYKPTILIIEHDKTFLEKISSKEIVL